jgi:hypothetical protein
MGDKMLLLRGGGENAPGRTLLLSSAENLA